MNREQPGMAESKTDSSIQYGFAGRSAMQCFPIYTFPNVKYYTFVTTQGGAF